MQYDTSHLHSLSVEQRVLQPRDSRLIDEVDTMLTQGFGADIRYGSALSASSSAVIE